jgi:hypothetical protein
LSRGRLRRLALGAGVEALLTGSATLNLSGEIYVLAADVTTDGTAFTIPPAAPSNLTVQ